MKIECPHGYHTSVDWDGYVMYSNKVTIYNGVCDSPDLCGIKDCQYANTNQGGTWYFLKGMLHTETLQGHLKEKERQRQYDKQQRFKVIQGGQAPQQIEPYRCDLETCLYCKPPGQSIWDRKQGHGG